MTLWFEGFFFVSFSWEKTETKVLLGFLVTQQSQDICGKSSTVLQFGPLSVLFMRPLYSQKQLSSGNLMVRL